ncbi:WxL domain-containing protein [Levilactobacillus lanxiensis]|uniref:WxL domain-containing protein n=1 Tax=Levilactobacillus lanxiensis TaxID=2799568 RepID=A0ABW4D1Q6_9LACO|nr:MULTISPECIES: WxL domain-containing protein [Levilactobacillus]
MRVLKLLSGVGSTVAVAAAVLALNPLVAGAAGPGTATSNLTNVSSGYVADSTGNAEATSNAEFTVTPGTLSLNQVPNIMLGTVSVKDIATANTTVPVTSGAPTSGTAYDGNNTGTLNVTDFRGNNAGWSLSVGLSPFTSGKSTITNATLNLNQTPGTLDNSATAAPSSLKLTQSAVTNGWISSPQTLWNASAETGEGNNSATTATSSNLLVDQQPTIVAGTYDATLYWALQNAPATTTPAQ